jgi:uncharacterized membrane protein
MTSPADLATQQAQAGAASAQELSEQQRKLLGTSLKEAPEEVAGAGQQAASGAATGAQIGAALGTVVPGLGNVVGGLIGAGVGAAGGAISGGLAQKKQKKETKDAYMSNLAALERGGIE